MKTTTDIINMMAEYQKRMDKHLSDYKESKDTFTSEDYRRFNALIFALDRAYSELEKGLTGEI